MDKMTRLTCAFKLFQPWSTEIVEGKLKYLVRSFNTNKRGRVGIYNTKTIDQNWYKNVDTEKKEKLWKKQGIIGSIKIKDSFFIDRKKIKDTLIKLASTKYYDYYPKHLIPDNMILYIWVLDNAKKWTKPLNIEKKGMCWIRIDVEDE